ncbi:energy transducer TonB [Carboxylicivirga sp. M1479]|uniref:energy transducer TonB n=1 Tax=Carboxylicivirga sp. M1479 TaxID=2594476 RepID=UPI0011773F24|nr:energy transducer TonB [Carboxylicivirga sp. M1479]TRX70849.1 hypothetical protein FNN09_09305 [Carboxylicivirga sp. M1479]
MSKKNRHTKPHDKEAFQKYLKNEMSNIDAHNFERELLKDPFESDALDGLSTINEDDFDSDIKKLKSKLRKTPSLNWKHPILYVAASVIIVIGIISILWQLTPSDTVYVSDNTNMKTELDIPKQIENTSIKAAKSQVVPNNTTQTKEEEEKEVMQKMDQASLSIVEENEEDQEEAFELAEVESISIDKSNNESSSRLEQEVMKVNYPTEIKSEGAMGATAANRNLAKKRSSLSKQTSPPKADHKESTVQAYSVAYSNFDDSAQNIDTNISQKTSLPQTALSVQSITTDSNYTDNISNNNEFNIAIKSKGNNLNREARPIGGMKKYITEIEKTLVSPANGSNKQKLVKLKLSIDKQGNITNIEVKKSPGDEYSSIAIQAIRNGAGWQPTIKNGITTADIITLQLRFLPVRQ